MSIVHGRNWSSLQASPPRHDRDGGRLWILRSWGSTQGGCPPTISCTSNSDHSPSGCRDLPIPAGPHFAAQTACKICNGWPRSESPQSARSLQDPSAQSRYAADVPRMHKAYRYVCIYVRCGIICNNTYRYHDNVCTGMAQTQA